MHPINLISLLVVLAAGCAGAAPASAPDPTGPVTGGQGDQDDGDTDHPEEDSSDEEPVICDEVPVPASLVTDNIATTDWSGVVRVDSADVVGADGGPPASTGYVNHRYRVTVLEAFRGEAAASFVFLVMADADIKPIAPGAVLFVSLCRGDGDAYYSPDNGYVFPAPEVCVAAVRGLEIPPSSGETPAACER